MKTNYITTKKQCQHQIDEWKNVCTNCGGELIPLETVDNARQPTYWIGCESCQIFNNGTKERIYKIASRMVDEKHFRAYNHEDVPDKEKEPDRFDYWRKGQISGAVWVVLDVLRFDKNSRINS